MGCVWVIAYILVSSTLAGSIGLVYRFLMYTHTHMYVEKRGYKSILLVINFLAIMKQRVYSYFLLSMSE
jgi:high-affinity Fe2+/Pb2+ permease